MQEGRLIDNIYLIKDYLICKRDVQKRIKPVNSSEFRSEIKPFISSTHEPLTKLVIK